MMKKIFNFTVDKIYYPISTFFRRYFEKISRSLAYAKFGWSNPDWDNAYLYEHIAFKLKRMKRVMENGFTDLTSGKMPEAMKALNEAIMICDRLAKDDYELEHFDKHELKWGDYSREYYEDGIVPLIRTGVKTDEDFVQERKEFHKMWEDVETDIKKDFDRLGEIFRDYSRCWWE